MTKFVYHVNFTWDLTTEEWYVLAANRFSAVKKAMVESNREKDIWFYAMRFDTVKTHVDTNVIQTSFTSLDDIQVETKTTGLLQ
jgi:hypothetical protein